MAADTSINALSATATASITVSRNRDPEFTPDRYIETVSDATDPLTTIVTTVVNDPDSSVSFNRNTLL